MPFAYEQILYPSLPFNQTHPDRLATLATLFGIEPAPVDSCRVLEVGCADGGNIIPMACEFPGSHFFGIDAAQTVIRQGREQIDALGLTNVHLDQMDLMDAGAQLGTFDYIIAHGFYSWVPEPVRDKLLATAKALLRPNGVAYVSYNALPGCRIREMFREMLLFHVRDVTDPQARIDRSHELLRAMAESRDLPGDAGSFLKIEAQFLIEQGPAVLYHDELAETYHAVYVHDFLAHAAKHGLQFLSEANFREMQPGKYPQKVIEQVNQWSAGDRVLRELYLDYLKCRTFRQTLLCHAGTPIPDGPILSSVRGLYAASAARAVSEHPDLSSGVAEEFRGAGAAAAKTAHPLAKAALLLLSNAWPEALAFDDLLASAHQLTGEPPDAEGLSQILLGTYAAGLVELHVQPPRCVSRVSRFPQTTPLARRQAGSGKTITTPRHTSIDPSGEVERRLLALLDGSHDVSALTAELRPILNESDSAVTRKIEENLAKLARFGLLVA